MSNHSTSVRFTIDFTKKQIIGTKTSLEKAKFYGSDEYEELCALLEAHPRFSVVTKKVKRNSSKETYKGLNAKFFETYISIQPNAIELRQEYEEARKVAVMLGISIYPYIKSWFLKKFGTEDKPFDMKQAREKMKNAGLAAVQAQAAE